MRTAGSSQRQAQRSRRQWGGERRASEATWQPGAAPPAWRAATRGPRAAHPTAAGAAAPPPQPLSKSICRRRGGTAGERGGQARGRSWSRAARRYNGAACARAALPSCSPPSTTHPPTNAAHLAHEDDGLPLAVVEQGGHAGVALHHVPPPLLACAAWAEQEGSRREAARQGFMPGARPSNTSHRLCCLRACSGNRGRHGQACAPRAGPPAPTAAAPPAARSAAARAPHPDQPAACPHRRG